MLNMKISCRYRNAEDDMLRTDQNDFITQTGPATPMGQLFRSYWTPALLAEELPQNDCPPVNCTAYCRARIPHALAVAVPEGGILCQEFVFGARTDPVAAGLVTSLNRPGASLTGISTFSQDLGPKRLS